jgi:hypothetical protein
MDRLFSRDRSDWRKDDSDDMDDLIHRISEKPTRKFSAAREYFLVSIINYLSIIYDCGKAIKDST